MNAQQYLSAFAQQLLGRLAHAMMGPRRDMCPRKMFANVCNLYSYSLHQPLLKHRAKQQHLMQRDHVALSSLAQHTAWRNILQQEADAISANCRHLRQQSGFMTDDGGLEHTRSFAWVRDVSGRLNALPVASRNTYCRFLLSRRASLSIHTTTLI